MAGRTNTIENQRHGLPGGMAEEVGDDDGDAAERGRSGAY